MPLSLWFLAQAGYRGGGGRLRTPKQAGHGRYSGIFPLSPLGCDVLGFGFQHPGEDMTEHPIRRVLTQAGVAMARPQAFLIVLVYVAAWVLFQPETLDWHALATVATWIMTLFIQRAEHRDTQALHAKLDELLRAQTGARSELARVDDGEPEDIEEQRAADNSRP